MHRHLFWLGLVAVWFWGAHPAAAQTPLFTDTAPIQITLDGPFTDLVGSARTNTNPYPATFTMQNQTGAPLTLHVQMRARGLTRRTAGFCNFPPIGLDFDHGEVHGTLFEGQHKLKLVTYCSNSDVNERQIALEYLSYRFYNLITPESFRVRAAQVTYHDNQHHMRDVTRFGFLIEDIGDVAKRNHLTELKVGGSVLTQAQLEPRAAARLGMFEYMIANQDWDYIRGPAGATCCHNVRLLSAEGASGNYPVVPYDFDYSGFVGTRYATPPEQLPISDVRTRFFRGLCRHNGEVPAVVEEFRAHHAEMTALLANEPLLDPGIRTRANNFLEAFFAIIDDPAKVQRQLIAKCRGG
jgi:hypothetical protein